jgi:hypothetical protein
MFRSQLAALRGAGYPDRLMVATAAGFVVSILWPSSMLGELAAALATASLSYQVISVVMFGLLQLAAKRDLIKAPGAAHVAGRAMAVFVLTPLALWSPADPQVAAVALIAAPICGVLLAISALWFHRRRAGPRNGGSECAVE